MEDEPEQMSEFTEASGGGSKKGKTVELSLKKAEELIGGTPLMDHLTLAAKAQGSTKKLKIPLTPDEVTYAKDHPMDSAIGAFLAIGAMTRYRDAFPNEGKEDQQGDAVRHCFWGARMTQFLGRFTASDILANHEQGRPNAYDGYNNGVAVTIGLQNNTLSASEMWAVCMAASLDGTLKYDGSPSGPTTGAGAGTGTTSGQGAPTGGNTPPDVGTGGGTTNQGGGGGGEDVDRPRPGDRPRPERPERPERPDRPERPGRPERSDRPERPDRPDRSGPPIVHGIVADDNSET